MTAVKTSATYWMAVLDARGPEGKCECLSIHYIIIEDHATFVVAGIGVHFISEWQLLGTRPKGEECRWEFTYARHSQAI